MGYEHRNHPFNMWLHNGVFSGDLKFHKSWDWLMPVVEKIRNLVIPEEIFGDWPQHVSVTLTHHRCWITVGDNHKIFNQNGDVYSNQEAATTSIEATYNTVIYFIQWYNEYVHTDN